MTAPLRRSGRTGPAIDISIRSKRWEAIPSAARIVRRAIRAASPGSNARAEVSVVLTDDARIRRLNRQWRGQDKATNVLSFPAAVLPRSRGRRRNAVPAHGLLGDIVIAYQTTASEASLEGKAVSHHLAHLAVHGYLHLLGYDHECARDARVMENLERTILARIHVPDPYCERARR